MKTYHRLRIRFIVIPPTQLPLGANAQPFYCFWGESAQKLPLGQKYPFLPAMAVHFAPSVPDICLRSSSFCHPRLRKSSNIQRSDVDVLDSIMGGLNSRTGVWSDLQFTKRSCLTQGRMFLYLDR